MDLWTSLARTMTSQIWKTAGRGSVPPAASPHLAPPRRARPTHPWVGGRNQPWETCSFGSRMTLDGHTESRPSPGRVATARRRTEVHLQPHRVRAASRPPAQKRSFLKRRSFRGSSVVPERAPFVPHWFFRKRDPLAVGSPPVCLF